MLIPGCIDCTDDECSCHTNHALDQFLEHLIITGIERIIRIGGHSKSEVLEGKNLRVVSQAESKSKTEGYLLAKIFTALEDHEKTIRKLLARLHGIRSLQKWTDIKSHLYRVHRSIHDQFSRLDNEGFQKVGRNPFDIWISDSASFEPAQPEEVLPIIEQLLAQAMHDVHSIPSHDRPRLVEYWCSEIHNEVTDELFEALKETIALHKQRANIHDEVDRRILQTADVIGVTTTGLAKKIATLQHVRSKVVICEEAGEVMEPHMLSALLPSVEHFVQIGDHEQLRPQINNHKLSLESQQGISYQLDRSQFERLSIGERGRPAFPLAQLNVQRRMRPEISKFIKEIIYPRLVNHNNVINLPDVVGMRENVFWLDHDCSEEGSHGDAHQKSKSNLWEVDMTHALVRHIIRQGVYKSTDIAVLTPYVKQLQKLRNQMRNDFEIVLSDRDQETLTKEGLNVEEFPTGGHQKKEQIGSGMRPLEKKQMSELLRVATVDNFQGEEAKVVIVSLVRSNEGRKLGFLKTRNRINVLISRAQHGMYLIGNADCYSQQPTWARIQGMLQVTNLIGKSFGLCCPRHPETVIEVCQPEDFARFSPEGGCQLACDRRLPDCGHMCQARCHSESMHQVFACPKPCERLHSPCSHPCQKATCGEDCGLCMVPLDDIKLPCGHLKDNVPCHLTQDVGKVRCTVPVLKEVPECKHEVEVPCLRDVASSNFTCPTNCQSILACGHPCPGTCGQCNRKEDANRVKVEHRRCSTVCGRRFGTCNHTCPRPCHEGKDCGPCMADCEVSCSIPFRLADFITCLS